MYLSETADMASVIRTGCSGTRGQTALEETQNSALSLDHYQLNKKTNRCFLRCPVLEQSTHHFPNQKKNLDRFKAWVEAIDRKLETDEDYEYFRTKRLCHIHFIPMYCYNERRLSPLAIPTLYLTKQSRDDYWAKDIALRNLALQSKSPDDNAEITKAETQKNEAVTNSEEPVMEVVKEEIIPSNYTQRSLGSDVQESLVNLLIADILKGENENYTDVQDQPLIELSDLMPVESNVPNPVADIIIEYVPTTDEDSIQTILMNHKSPGDIATSEEVEKLPPEPDLSHDISVESTLLETCTKEIEKNLDSVQNCIQKPKRNVRRKSQYYGLAWDVSVRIPMEHNYSKASIVSPASHMSSNGVHPKKTITKLKSEVKELQKKLSYYKQRCKVLLRLEKKRVANQIQCKNITKISPKEPASHIRAMKTIINYLKHKNVGCGVSLPRNV